MSILRGKPVSSGIVSAHAHLFFSHENRLESDHPLPASSIDNELNRLQNALKKSRAQLKKIHKTVEKKMGSSSALIIAIQGQLLDDPSLIKEIKEKITREQLRCETAIRLVEKKYIDIFSKIPDLTFQERQNDLSDILQRIAANLSSQFAQSSKKESPYILVTRDLHPSKAAQIMSSGLIAGLILEEGGENSHTSILARTMGIPAVIQVHKALDTVQEGDFLFLDALLGQIYVAPSKEEIFKLNGKKEKYTLYKTRLKEIIPLPSQTMDGQNFSLMGNIELEFETTMAKDHGAAGIGLFRTEFLFMDGDVAQHTSKQALIYKNVAQSFYPSQVVIRTFDVGRDKAVPDFNNDEGCNSALGAMAVRIFLKKPDLLIRQIKGIIRANESGNISILFPMITTIEEIFSLKALVKDCYAQVKKEQATIPKCPPVGIMVEVPAAIKLIPFLKDHIDFFSVGSNDLTQYLLAVDRNNSEVSSLYTPFHPALVEALLEISSACRSIGKPVTVCGEMAGKSVSALMLLGMGFRRFSMNPLALMEIKRVLTHVHASYATHVVKKIRHFPSASMIEEYLIEQFLRKYPELFIKQPFF